MTSGMMSYKIKKEHPDALFLFANTGQEREETLVFVDACDKAFGLGVVWLEARVNPIKRKATQFTVVDYHTADRNGRVFEDVIKKYGIPNQAYPHCNRELKLAPINTYVKALGLGVDDRAMAVGIRNDEVDRISKDRVKNGLVYPLIEWWPSTKQDVASFWERQNFSLGLKEHEGNCRWCWKKTDRKILTLIQDRPGDFLFPEEMENKHGLKGSNKDGTHRVLFRKNRTTKDMIALSKKPFNRFVSSPLDTENLEDFDPELDVGGGCEESCEIF